jgi:molybdate transport system substrate-binding protein
MILHPVVARLSALFATAMLAVAAQAETARVAVASNFLATAEALGERFEQSTKHRVEWVPGSTGKLYAQIVNGAPFDLFLAADADRPRRLEALGLAVDGSRRTYARGRLMAWSRDPAADGSACLAALRPGVPGKVAIANPEVAPYGAAAREYLVHEGLWDDIGPRLVLGENVAQTLQFAANGGAVVALVAASQLADGGSGLPGGICSEAVPAEGHAPIEQQLVWLRRAADNPAAAAFLDYLAGEEAGRLIEASGYELASQ